MWLRTGQGQRHVRRYSFSGALRRFPGPEICTFLRFQAQEIFKMVQFPEPETDIFEEFLISCFCLLLTALSYKMSIVGAVGHVNKSGSVKILKMHMCFNVKYI